MYGCHATFRLSSEVRTQSWESLKVLSELVLELSSQKVTDREINTNGLRDMELVKVTQIKHAIHFLPRQGGCIGNVPNSAEEGKLTTRLREANHYILEVYNF